MRKFYKTVVLLIVLLSISFNDAFCSSDVKVVTFHPNTSILTNEGLFILDTIASIIIENNLLEKYLVLAQAYMPPEEFEKNVYLSYERYLVIVNYFVEKYNFDRYRFVYKDFILEDPYYEYYGTGIRLGLI